MKKTLRPYQQELLAGIFEKIKTVNRLCVQLSTGGGKTVIFTELVSQLNTKTLILVDSIDLVHQTVDTFKKQGIDVGCVLAGNKKFPENFRFQLTQEKYEILRSQIATLEKQKNTNKQGVFFDGYIFTKAIV